MCNEIGGAAYKVQKEVHKEIQRRLIKMAEEKILKDEILSDEQLDNVAGGSDWEIRDDANRLRGLHRLGYNYVTSDQVNDAMWRLGQDIGLNIGCDMKEGDRSNSYYLDNKKISRERLWEKIDRRIDELNRRR